ncbi:MAG: ion transporter, partial [Myxococcales bacterium]|nr:ion transporter [Myxococcales bacterium]
MTAGRPESSTPLAPWRRRLHEIIFEADTREGLAFDVALLAAVIASVLVVVLASVAEIQASWGEALYVAEWTFTLLFTVEYVLRLISVGRPLRYATSFFGVIDLVSIVPTYASLFLPGAESLLVVRILRLLRVFRVFKLVQYVVEGQVLWDALLRSRNKITVFLTTVLTIVVVMGSVMFVIEGPAGGFTSIPVGIYWAIVTLTTVGYGDISPTTPVGRMLASAVMVLGYAIIAVPTGVVTSELIKGGPTSTRRRACPECSLEGHQDD